VVCVWAGNARLALELRADDDVEDAFLNSTVEPRAAVVSGYRVELLELRPATSSGSSIPQGQYVARLRVERT
jgi:hypothetical protein